MVAEETDGKDSPAESLVADAVMASFANKNKGFAAALKFFRNVRNGPFRVSEGKLKDGIALIATSHLEAFPNSITEKVDSEMYERATNPMNLVRLFEEQADNLNEVALNQLGTHTSKVPNTQNTGPGALYRDEDIYASASSSPFLSSATIRQRLTLGGAGNAAVGRAWRFLSTKIRLGEVVLDLSADIAAKGPIYDALLQLGYPSRKLDELIDALLAGRTAVRDLTPGGNTKGLIWPASDGDIVLSPVHPFAMHVEIHGRLKERKSDPEVWIPTSYVVIGGEKPQNGGLVNNDIGGHHPLLVSLPPEAKSSFDRFAFRIAASGAVAFTPLRQRDPMAVKLARLLANGINNDAARSALRKQAADAVVVCLSAYLDLVDALSEKVAEESGNLAMRALRALPEPTRALLKEGFDAGRDEHRAFVDETAAAAMTPFPSHDDLRKVFKGIAADVIAAKFKGVRND